MKAAVLFFLFSVVLSAQCKIVLDERNQEPMAVGFGDRSVFDDSTFSSWFDKEYAFYHVDEEVFDNLETGLHNLNITIVMGTWCHDSQREVPRFFKILDKLDFPDENLRILFVDRKKKGLKDEAEKFDIEYVPTFIFFRNDEEIGRIVESPIKTLEEDIIDIVE